MILSKNHKRSFLQSIQFPIKICIDHSRSDICFREKKLTTKSSKIPCYLNGKCNMISARFNLKIKSLFRLDIFFRPKTKNSGGGSKKKSTWEITDTLLYIMIKKKFSDSSFLHFLRTFTIVMYIFFTLSESRDFNEQKAHRLF